MLLHTKLLRILSVEDVCIAIVIVVIAVYQVIRYFIVVVVLN